MAFKTLVNPQHFTRSGGAYSQGVSVDLGTGRLIFVTGQIAVDEQGIAVAPGDASEQTTFIFEKIKRILAEAGAGIMDIVKVQIFVTDMRDFPRVSAIRNDYLGESRPASTFLEVKRLVREGCSVEIEVVAAVLSTAVLGSQPNPV